MPPPGRPTVGHTAWQEHGAAQPAAPPMLKAVAGATDTDAGGPTRMLARQGYSGTSKLARCSHLAASAALSGVVFYVTLVLTLHLLTKVFISSP